MDIEIPSLQVASKNCFLLTTNGNSLLNVSFNKTTSKLIENMGMKTNNSSVIVIKWYITVQFHTTIIV